jgi:hypothetical protein
MAITTGSIRVKPGGSGCELDSNGCATDGAGIYGANEDCEFEVLGPVGALTVQGALDIEACCGCDYIEIDGTKFVGGDCAQFSAGIVRPATSLVLVPVATDSTFTWHSDGGSEREGWTVCFAEGTGA